MKIAHTLHMLGYKTAVTLVFTIAQAMACINASVDYVFFFLGRSEEMGNDALRDISAIQSIINNKHYDTKLVAASIKNLYQLEMLAKNCIDYAAIPYDF